MEPSSRSEEGIRHAKTEISQTIINRNQVSQASMALACTQPLVVHSLMINKLTLWLAKIQNGFKIALCRSVVNFVTAKAPKFNRVQQTSTSGPQMFPQESTRIHRVLQRSSIRFSIWFGTRRPEVQILSPRPFFSRSSPETWVTECTGYIGNTFGPKGFFSGSSTRVSRSKYPRSYSIKLTSQMSS